jgi:hypothetical protein
MRVICPVVLMENRTQKLDVRGIAPIEIKSNLVLCTYNSPYSIKQLAGT